MVLNDKRRVGDYYSDALCWRKYASAKLRINTPKSPYTGVPTPNIVRMFTCHVGVLRIAARAHAVAVRPGRGLGPRVTFWRAEIPSGCLARRDILARGKRVRRPQGRGAGVSRASWFSARGDPVRVSRAASPGCKQLGECSGGRVGRPQVSARRP